MTSELNIARLDIPRPPRPRQPMIYGHAYLFGRRAVVALEKVLPRKFGQAIRMDGLAIAARLNDLEIWFNARDAVLEGASDSEYFQYAKAIAQHAAALGELLYGMRLMPGLAAPGNLSIQAREALYHMGTPEGISPDDMLPLTDAAASGVVLLHHAALHASAQWAEMSALPKAKLGKPHIRGLVHSLADLHSEVFGQPRLRQPSPRSHEVLFCHFLARALFKRLARLHAAPLPAPLLELRALDEFKIAEMLRPKRDRRAKGAPGFSS